MPIARRSLLQIPAAGAVTLLLGSRRAPPASEAADWPQWAPTRADLYARIAADAGAHGTDIRRFGARLDGRSDDSDAMERALASGARVLLIPGSGTTVMRITRQLRIAAPVTIVGMGERPTIRCEQRDRDLFRAYPESDDPARFLTGVRFDNLHFDRPEGKRAHGKALRGYNLCDVSVTRCSARRMGLVGMHHARQRLGLYRRARGTIQEDPAVLAGFSATSTDDLCEGLFVYDNDVDGESYMSQIARFEFTRRVAAAHNVGRFANISWWGGGGRRDEGGDPRHLRRVRDVYAADNVISHANGGVYGNNGQHIVVARNHVSMISDIGIDFEGCFDAVAYDNYVEHAGNYCFATFFAAKNILFRNNVGVQDGTGEKINERLGAPGAGAVTGRALFGMRSAGFGAVDGAITVKLIDNDFRWKGETLFGVMRPSYFTSLELRGNRFENVECDLNYRRTTRVIAENNLFTMNRAADRPFRFISSNAAEIRIADNRIRSAVEQPAASFAVLAQLSQWSRAATISGNDIRSAGGTLPVVVRGEADPGVRMTLADNSGAPIFAGTTARISASNNKDASGRAVRPAPLPEEYILDRD
ncbi:right-handed parallel beta-helix repeat-containing protein [Stakelama tenebrarum]|uniref:Right-handed parallel beta-helix repeat-containing protein n=1 Tax=Stakelama tenebrarum TaxID=2711215 RepID=A0A6G6Y3L0_9SPHN|nr:right-handed parallel beta-helix repeat-containing protein [Sphingosinithalassobacter tenebrarum]QIG79534.1 right-handed parallel beta-helix repeat-containing protein [Sphingosinithalassobacter tenebrarum]